VTAVVVPTVKVYATEPSVLVTEVADAPSVIVNVTPVINGSVQELAPTAVTLLDLNPLESKN